MPKKQRSELKAGIFVIAAMIIIFGVVLWLGGSNFFHKATGQAVFYADNTGGPLGLAPDFAVKINDVKVGKIASVTIDEGKKRTLYVVEFDKKGLKMYSNGEAKVSTGLIGDGFLVITSVGSADKPLADEKNPILISGGLGEVMDNFNVISKNLKDISISLKNELDEKIKDSILSKIKSITDELAVASKKIAQMTTNLTPETDPNKPGTIIASIKKTSKNLAETTTTIDVYVQKDIRQLLATVREISNSVLKTANNLDVTSEQIKKLVVGNSDNLDEMIDNMVAVSADLEAAAKKIRRNPWLLLYKPDKKKMRSTNIYDATAAFSEGATQLNIVVTKLKALRLLDAKNPQAEKEVKNIRKKLMDSFKSFKKVEDMLWKEASK